MSKSYGSLYVVDGATAQSLTTAFAKMTGFAAAGPTTNDHGDKSVVPVLASDKITLKPGVYEVALNISGISSTAGDVEAQLCLDGTAISAAPKCRANFATGNADNSMSMVAIVTVSTEDDLTVEIKASTALDFTPIHANLTVKRID